MADYVQLAREIRKLVAENELVKAINLLMENLADDEDLDEILLQSARLTELRQRARQDTITDDLIGRERSKIILSLLDLVRELEHKGRAETRVFISYHRKQPSQGLAQRFHDALEDEGYSAFMDVVDIIPGADWAQTILSELKASDYFVLFISEETNYSEMVIKEVEEARRLRSKYGKPIILPVRVEYPFEKPLSPKLHKWLFRIQQLIWQREKDTEYIIKSLLEVISARKRPEYVEEVEKEEVEEFIDSHETPPLPVASLEVPRGAVRIGSKFYVERGHESGFIQHVNAPGALLRIRGPRQFGKTSLLARVIDFARNSDHRVIAVDFQNITDATLRDLESLLFEFCTIIAEEFEQDDELDDLWEKRKNRDPKQRASNFLRRKVLRDTDQPVLLAMDEADRVFNYPEVSNDFFLMLRGWHEGSKTQPIWEKLKMAISYSTEAKLAIRDLNSSPFNVGEEARIPPFDMQQIQDLAQRHHLQMSDEQLQKLSSLMGGQPYLTRRAMYLIAKKEYSFDELVSIADKNEGPFSDHLRHHLINVMQFKDARAALKDIVEHGRCNDAILISRLQATGLIRGNLPHVYPACELYKSYFTGRL